MDPHRPRVVADGVENRVVGRERGDAEVTQHRRSHQRVGDPLSLARGERSGAQGVAHVGSDTVHRTGRAVDGHREVALVGRSDPEPRPDALLEHVGPLLELHRPCQVRPARGIRRVPVRRGSVVLWSASARRSAAAPTAASTAYACASMSAMGEAAIDPSRNRIESPESFHPWLARPWPLSSTYLMKPSSSGVARSVSQDVAARRCGSRERTSSMSIPQRHASCSRQDPQGRGVHRAPVDRGQAEVHGHVLVCRAAQLVGDLSRRLRRVGVTLRALTAGEGSERAGGERRSQRQHHSRRPERVPAEKREVPRGSGPQRTRREGRRDPSAAGCGGRPSTRPAACRGAGRSRRPGGSPPVDRVRAGVGREVALASAPGLHLDLDLALGPGSDERRKVASTPSGPTSSWSGAGEKVTRTDCASVSQ